MGEAKHIDAAVPRQPNFSDCGIYLVHFMERFFSDPDRFCELIYVSHRFGHYPCTVLRRWNHSLTLETPSLQTGSNGEDESWRDLEVAGKRQYWRDVIGRVTQEYQEFSERRKEEAEKAKNEGGLPKLNMPERVDLSLDEAKALFKVRSNPFLLVKAASN